MSPCIRLPSVAPTPKPLSTAARRWRSSGRKSGASKRAAWGHRRSSRPPPRPSLWMVRAGRAPWVSCQGRSQPTKSINNRDGVPAAGSEGGQATAPSRQESLRIPAWGAVPLGWSPFHQTGHTDGLDIQGGKRAGRERGGERFALPILEGNYFGTFVGSNILNCLVLRKIKTMLSIEGGDKTKSK